MGGTRRFILVSGVFLMIVLSVFVGLDVTPYNFITFKLDPLRRQNVTMDEMRERMDYVRSMCQRNPNGTFAGKRNATFFTFEGSNICLCKVAKAGSTFWTRTLMVLKEPEHADALMHATGVRVHSSNVAKERVTCDEDKDSRKLRFFITRDPYDRLYSSYLDKIYLPKFGKISLGLSVLANTKQGPRSNFAQRFNKAINDGYCSSHNATFPQFLDFVILQMKKHQVFDVHFAPISSLCSPCQRDFDFVLRHENFRSESTTVINHLNISEHIREGLKSQLREESVRTSVINLFDTLRTVAKDRALRRCRERDDFTMPRVWTVLKLKGYIPDGLTLPSGLLTEDITSANLSALLSYLQPHFLRNENQEAQRRRHMMAAYRHVSPRLIRGIQQLFERDFILFQYDSRPPEL